MNEQTLQIINTIITILLPVLATGLTSVISLWVLKMKSKVNDDISKQVVDDTVKFVQQIYSNLNGEEKLQKAIDNASEVLQSKGIKVGEAELRMLIESAVYGVKQGLEGGNSTDNNNNSSLKEVSEEGFVNDGSSEG